MSRLGLLLVGLLLAKALVAAPLEFLPELEVTTLDQRPATLASFKGQALLLNVWATWCVPCREEMPSLQHLADSRQPFRIVALSLDEDANLVKEFALRFGIRLPILLARNSMAAQAKLAENGVPVTWLIGPDGRVKARYIGTRTWDQDATLADILKALSAPTRTQ